MKRILLILFSVLSVGVGVLGVQSPVLAADSKDQICQGVTAVTGGGCQNDSGSIQGLVTTIVNVFSVIIGVIAVIMIMVGGFKYVTAAGDSGKVTSARNTILYAIVGLVIVALSQALVKFVINTVR